MVKELMRFLKCFWVETSENSVGHKKAAEHQNFSHHKYPHALLRGFELFVRIREMVSNVMNWTVYS
jgi:hypothetical protein